LEKAGDMRPILLLAMFAVLAMPSAAQVYKWIDSTGKTQYGDRPPEDARKEQLKIDVRSYDGPVQVTDWAAVIRKKAPVTARVGAITMYSTSWCVHCKRARNFFAANHITYTEVDVEASEAGKRDFKELGGGGVPLILVGDKAMRGFDEQRMKALLKPS
jgi:glutaredoxin